MIMFFMKTSIISEWKLWRLETITMPLKHSLLRVNVVLRKKSHRYSLRETQKKLISSIQEKVLIEIEKESVEKLYADALIERDALSKMAEAAAPDPEMKMVIKERLALLNKVIASYITDSSSAIRRQMHRKRCWCPIVRHSWNLQESLSKPDILCSCHIFVPADCLIGKSITVASIL
jgi:hypothetical protein